MNESLYLKREKKVTKTPIDVTKGGYLGKEWCPVFLGTLKKCDVLLNHHYVLFPLFEK